MQNILESQVTDLTHLADSPIATVAAYDMTGRRASSAAESPARESGKRKTDDSPSGGAQRAKRNRYISIACNECKRRKIKCNGNTPCQRCGNLNLECQYAPNCCANGFKDSEEFRHMNAQIASLQDQVNELYSSLHALRGGDPLGLEQTRNAARSASISQLSANATSPGVASMSYRANYKYPQFRGPTSSVFGLNVAKNTLHTMGYPGLADGLEDGLNTQDDTPIGTPPRQALPLLGTARDPLFSMNKEEAIRLARVYEEEMGLMYPVVDIEQLIDHASIVYSFMDHTKRHGLGSESGSEVMRDHKTHLLKMAVANALLVEQCGQSPLGEELFKSVREAASDILSGDVIDIKGVPLLVEVAIWWFHHDNEEKAWRVAGQAARVCIELGLHRRDSLFRLLPDDEERAWAVRTFWSIYVLDRRWSFGTGMPFSLQDGDIDPSLPEPSRPGPRASDVQYLKVMISYFRIGSRVWRSVAGFESASSPDFKSEEAGYLDYQIQQWQKAIPPELQLPTANSPPSSTRAMHRLQILLYLRTNQMRILIYRPVLHTANSIMENLSYAHTVIEIAKDTIRALTHLNQTSNIYRVQQSVFNYFLVSALAVLFLGTCHAPVEFSGVCRDEFYMALDLVKGFTSNSYISKRLWRTIKGLKEVGPRLGLSQDPQPPSISNVDDPHSDAALAMAGLAGHEISGMGNYLGNQPDNSLLGHSPVNGRWMSVEMTNLFEAALGAGGMNGQGYVADMQSSVDGDSLAGVPVGMAAGNYMGSEEELYRQLRDLF